MDKEFLSGFGAGHAAASGGGGGDEPTGTININSNGTHNVKNYASANVNVPNSFDQSDEGKVVSNGALVSQTSDTVTENDTYDTTLIDSLTVDVTSGGGYTIDDIANRSYVNGTTPYDIVIPNAIRIAPFAFSRGNMRSVSAPYVKYFTQHRTETSGNGGYAFERCTSLQSVNLPELVDCGSSGYQFGGCTALTSVHMPKSNFSTYMFDSCTSLQNIALGYGRTTKTETATYMFYKCSALKCVDLSNISKLNSNLIRQASACDTIILRDDVIVPCGSINVFDGSQFANNGAGGTIYIPESLYNHLGDGSSLDYKAATNWSTYNGYGTITWAKIEGSYYETNYADGTVIS